MTIFQHMPVMCIVPEHESPRGATDGGLSSIMYLRKLCVIEYRDIRINEFKSTIDLLNTLLDIIIYFSFLFKYK